MLCALFACTRSTATLAALVDSDLSLLIRVVYSPAAPVGSSWTLRGDGLGLNWTTGAPLAKDSSDGSYTIVLHYPPNLAGSIVSMKPLLNGKYSIGANVEVRLASSPAATTLTITPWFGNQDGRIVYLKNVVSPGLKNTRDVVVYLPPSYDENKAIGAYPLLLLQDGQNLFNASTSFGGIAWRCDRTANELIAEGGMREIVMVGIDNADAERIDEYTYSADPQYGGGNAKMYLDFLLDTVVPLVRTTFPRVMQSGTMGIGGSSLGGLFSCWAAWVTPAGTFDTAICMSSSFWWNSYDFNNTIVETSPTPLELTQRIYLDTGDQDGDTDIHPATIAVDQHATALGLSPFYFLDRGGSHDESSWGARFHVPMTTLYKPEVRVPTSNVEVRSTNAIAALPEVFSVDPSSGAAGELVGVAGSGFVNSSALICRWGEVNASIFFFKSETVIYAHAPVQPASDDTDVAKRVLVSCSNDGVAFSKEQPHDYFSYVGGQCIPKGGHQCKTRPTCCPPYTCQFDGQQADYICK